MKWEPPLGTLRVPLPVPVRSRSAPDPPAHSGNDPFYPPDPFDPHILSGNSELPRSCSQEPVASDIGKIHNA
jgi:hypothetical protein